MNKLLNILLILLVVSAAIAGNSNRQKNRFQKKLFPKYKHKWNEKVRQCGYEGCPVPRPGMINVHLVPHTHDDVGWLKTVDEYYYGSRSNIQKAGVQYILDSVVEALLKDPEKRFIYAESAFFFKWWDEQTDDLKQKVKQLVNEGRLEFINGAWSMNDEASVHYQSVIDQFTWGLRQLNDTFGECGRPTIGWQVDPFGHSREMASLFAQMGFDGLFFGRMDYQDLAQRLFTKTMEFVWHASENLGDSSDLFTGMLYNQYQAPTGFCFDVLCNDEPIIDDKKVPDYNVDRRVNEFINHVRRYSSGYKTNNIMMTMGEDFHYQAAHMWYTNLDKLILYTNERQANGSNIHLFYSTPACYVKALHDANETWPTNTDDFFPYASDPHTFWTGYFTSRPTLKRYERIGNQFLQICKQLSALSPKKAPEFDYNLAYLREAMGIMQHHDAITGTEKQHVSDDYARILSQAIDACSQNIKFALNQLTVEQEPGNDSQPFEFKACQNLNISQCAISENSNSFVVTVYNPLSYSNLEYIRIPVNSSEYLVKDYRGVAVQHSLIPIADWVKNLHYRSSNASHELVFLAEELPPLGYKSYFISKVAADPEVVMMDEPQPKLEPFFIANRYVNISFDEHGQLTHISADGITTRLNQSFYYYEGALGNNEVFENRSSGAYIFRPKPNSSEYLVSSRVVIRVFETPEVKEVHQIFNEWVSQVIRIYPEEPYVELEWQVGPIPIEDNVGKEIIARFDTNIDSNGTFETDSNGRETLRRVRDFRETWNLTLREPISGNYYPITTKIAIQDRNARLSVLTDRGQGGSSLKDGSLELMLHRRLLHDDAFGVGEALNETAYGKGVISNGKLYLMFGNPNKTGPSVVANERFLQQRKMYASWLFFSDVTNVNYDHWRETYNNIYSGLSLSLPKNVNLMTLEPWKEDSVLVRFEHLLEKNEDSEYSKNVTFNLQDIFRGLNIIEVRETTLAANQWLSNAKRFQFRSTDRTNRKNTVSSIMDQDALSQDDDYSVTLKPMQIRTFVLSLEWRP